MSMSGWSTPENMETWMGDQRRQTDELNRRVRVPNARQIMGPGLGPWAVRLFDWNDEKTLYNGVFYSETGALNSPDPTKAWVGTSWATQDGRGTQEITEIGTSAPVYRRTFSTAPGATPDFTPWFGEGVWYTHTPNWPNCPIASIQYAKHMRTGNTIEVKERCVIAAGFTGNWFFAIPNAWRPGTPGDFALPLGKVVAFRSGGGWFEGWLAYTTDYAGPPLTAWLQPVGAGPAGTPASVGAWTGTVPVTWAAGDVAGVEYSLEIAP